MKNKVKVKGMMCGHCESRVQGAMMKLAGIEACVASATEGSVECVYDDTKVTLGQIQAVIEEVGYEVEN
ncbi:MAG: cation transporter [Longicatena sp.]